MCYVHTVCAQVNIEVARPKDKEGTRISFDTGVNLIRGNVNLSQVNIGARAQYIKGVHSPFVQASIAYGEKDEEAFLDQSFVHVRWTAMWWKRIGTEIFSQWQEDTFRSLILRQLYGAGIRTLLYQNKRLDIALGNGYMLERETSLENDREQLDINQRSTNYLTFHYKLKQVSIKTKHVSSQKNSSSEQIQTLISLNNTIYIQPLFNQPSDLRLLNDLSLTIKLSTHIELLETLSIMYDSRPPLGVEKTDLKSMTALRVYF